MTQHADVRAHTEAHKFELRSWRGIAPDFAHERN